MDPAIALSGHVCDDGLDIFSSTQSGNGGRPLALEGESLARAAIFDRAAPKVSQTVFISKSPSEERANATSAFWAGDDFDGFLEDFAFHRLLAQRALQSFTWA
ncbi:hypothetical protein ASD00_27265 [Ensifer sp. Root31]|nr:hypothetical protein ASD00_27265 [Ensifer sp. Root31]